MCKSFATFQWIVRPVQETDCTKLLPDFFADWNSFYGSWYCDNPSSTQVDVHKLFVAQIAITPGFDVGINLRVVEAGQVVTDAALICGPPSSSVVLPPLPGQGTTTAVFSTSSR